MDDQTKRFIIAYNRIDKFLRELCHAPVQKSFYSLIRDTSEKHAGVKHCADSLKRYGDLRNAIVHGMTDEAPLATPYITTVEDIERILTKLLAPPKLVSVLKVKPMTCSPNESIGVVAKRMVEESFSQLPVVRDSHLVGLLSTDTIARWFAAHIEEGGGLLVDESVDKVLEHAEHAAKSQPTYKIVNREATVFDAVGLFHDADTNGTPLHAIIITHGGTKGEAPLRIVTVYDVPKLLSFVRSGA